MMDIYENIKMMNNIQGDSEYIWKYKDDVVFIWFTNGLLTKFSLIILTEKVLLNRK